MNFDVETINKLLASDNFKERLAGELLELTIRIQNLEQFLNNYKADKLPFKPATPYELLYEQFVYMKFAVICFKKLDFLISPPKARFNS